MNTLELLTNTINALKDIQRIEDKPVQRLLDHVSIDDVVFNLMFIRNEMNKGEVPVNPVSLSK